MVYEAYEVKRKGGNCAVFYFAGKLFFYIFMKSLGPLFTMT